MEDGGEIIVGILKANQWNLYWFLLAGNGQKGRGKRTRGSKRIVFSHHGWY